jgi:preprotein translocase subunit SecE
MADKKKNTSRPASQTTRATLKTSEKEQPVKSISEMARDEADIGTSEKELPVKSISEMARDKAKAGAKTTTKPEGKATVKSVSETVRTEAKSTKESVKSESKTVAKSASSTARVEPKREQRSTQENRVRRERREPAWLLRFRNSRVGRFIFEAYYELRHKVTWPTFEEARNMTIIVIVLSAVIGLVLFAIDSGLTQLFLLISGGK